MAEPVSERVDRQRSALRNVANHLNILGDDGADIVVVLQGDGVTLLLRPDAQPQLPGGLSANATGEVRITAEREQQIEVERERTGSVYEENDVKGRAKLQERLDRDLEREAREAAERSRETLTKALEKRLADVREELDRVSARVAAEALKEKARSLGEIEELREDAETGELTIKVRV